MNETRKLAPIDHVAVKKTKKKTKFSPNLICQSFALSYFLYLSLYICKVALEFQFVFKNSTVYGLYCVVLQNSLGPPHGFG